MKTLEQQTSEIARSLANERDKLELQIMRTQQSVLINLQESWDSDQYVRSNSMDQALRPRNVMQWAREIRSRISDRLEGDCLPAYQTEEDHLGILDRCRGLKDFDSISIGVGQALCSYVIGGQWEYEVESSDPDKPAQKELLSKVETLWKKTLNDLRWDVDFLPKYYCDSIEDGERITAFYPTRNQVKLDVIFPEQITQPNNSNGLDNWLGYSSELTNWKYGVHVRKNIDSGRFDYKNQLGVFASNDEGQRSWEYLPNWPQPNLESLRFGHFKRNNIHHRAARGLSDYYPVSGELEINYKGARNLNKSLSVQAAIALIIKRNSTIQGTKTEVAGNAINEITRLRGAGRSGSSSSYDLYQRRVEGGSIIETDSNSEYSDGPTASDSQHNMIELSQFIGRRLSVRWNMPEFIYTGDASNNNYASSLVSHSPFIKYCTFQQAMVICDVRDIFWRIMRAYYIMGYFSPYDWKEIRETIELEISCPEIDVTDPDKKTARYKTLFDSGIIDRETWAAKEGLPAPPEQPEGVDLDPSSTTPPDSGDGNTGGSQGPPSGSSPSLPSSSDQRGAQDTGDTSQVQGKPKETPSEGQETRMEDKEKGKITQEGYVIPITEGVSAVETDSCGAGTGEGGGFGKGNTCGKSKGLRDEAIGMQKTLDGLYNVWSKETDETKKEELHKEYEDLYAKQSKLLGDASRLDEENDKKRMDALKKEWGTKEESREGSSEFYAKWKNIDDPYNDPQYKKEKEDVRKKENDWEEKIKRAISFGKLDQEDARNLGYIRSDGKKFEALPKEMWHVTTAFDKVLKSGLKTRKELGQSQGKGLGGGSDDTISFTDDKQSSIELKRAMLEAHRVANNQISIQNLVKDAETNGFLQNIKDSIVRGRPDEQQRTIDDLINGTERERSSTGKKPSKDGDWKPLEYSQWKDNKNLYSDWIKPKNPEDLQWDRFQFYKNYTHHRSTKMGIPDPLFFATDVKGFSEIDPNQIQIVKVKSKPNTKGYQVPAEKEWRVHFGDVVDIEGIENESKKITAEQIHDLDDEAFSTLVGRLWERDYGFALETWNEADHPRGDDGRFINKEEIQAAKKDPEKAKELRAKVTDPAERKKLDKKLESFSVSKSELDVYKTAKWDSMGRTAEPGTPEHEELKREHMEFNNAQQAIVRGEYTEEDILTVKGLGIPADAKDIPAFGKSTDTEKTPAKIETGNQAGKKIKVSDTKLYRTAKWDSKGRTAKVGTPEHDALKLENMEFNAAQQAIARGEYTQADIDTIKKLGKGTLPDSEAKKKAFGLFKKVGKDIAANTAANNGVDKQEAYRTLANLVKWEPELALQLLTNPEEH